MLARATVCWQYDPARPERLKDCSGAYMVQLSLQPAHRLTLHKVQASTSTHIVRGCLAGVFAASFLYSLIFRVADPQNLQRIALAQQICSIIPQRSSSGGAWTPLQIWQRRAPYNLCDGAVLSIASAFTHGAAGQAPFDVR